VGVKIGERQRTRGAPPDPRDDPDGGETIAAQHQGHTPSRPRRGDQIREDGAVPPDARAGVARPQIEPALGECHVVPVGPQRFHEAGGQQGIRAQTTAATRLIERKGRRDDAEIHRWRSAVFVAPGSVRGRGRGVYPWLSPRISVSSAGWVTSSYS
jgi:hypothetical protein